MEDIFFFFIVGLLVVVHDFDIVSIPVTPTETYTSSVIDPNAIFSRPIPAQRFQTVPRWSAKCIEIRCGINHPQLAHGYSLNITRKFSRVLLSKQLLRFAAPKGFYHDTIITSCVNKFKKQFAAT